MMSAISRLCLSVGVALLLVSRAAAEEPAADLQVSYYKQIRPIFQAHCQGCHQPAKPGGEYVMTQYGQLLAGGETGEAAVVAGKPEESNLLAQITPVDGQADMPKDKPPLAESEIELVRRWIEQGALDDTPADAQQKHDAEHPPEYVLPPVVTAIDYSPDGSLLAVSGYHEVLLHKADGSQLVARLVGLSERIESLAFSPDGKWLAVTGGQPCRMGEVQIWNVEQRSLKLSVPVTYDTVYGASWSPDGKFIAFGCADNSVRAIDAETGKQVFFNAASNDWVLDTAFSVDGKHLVSVGRDQTVKLFVFETERFVDNITSITPGALTGGIPAVDRHPQKDELLVGGSDGVPKTYLMHRTKKRVIGDDHQKIRHFDGLPGRAFSIEYSPDGERIAAGSSSNGHGELRVYQNADGKQLWRAETQAV
ncbi:MAG: PD40 domain-containing protein, partial [Planctomycetales bacterium]|nr:PD40 domain-containing protein [Planctomycetales bacterium]